MLQKGTVMLIILLLAGVICLGCSDLKQNAPLSPASSTTETKALSKNALAATAAKDNLMLPAFAKKLALGAANTNLRAALMRAVSQSGLDEKILSLKDMLPMNVATGTLAAAVSVSGEFIDAINAHPLGIDVYFPVDAHRHAMLENPQRDFLVTYCDGYQDDQAERQFSAWNRQGKEITLTTAVAPEIPVLVITQCEHKGHSTATALELPCGDPDCGGGGGGGGGSNPVAVLKVIHFRLMDDNEPWTAGDSEIYVRVGWGNPGQEQWIETEFPDVNDERYYWNYCKQVFDWPFWPGINTGCKFEVWEDDGWGTFGDDLLDDNWYQEGPNVTTPYVSNNGYAYWYRGVTHGDCDHYTQVKSFGASCP